MCVSSLTDCVPSPADCRGCCSRLPAHQGRGRPRTACSRECKSKAAVDTADLAISSMTCECPTCSRRFAVGHGKQRYCSDRCRVVIRGVINADCEICGSPFITRAVCLKTCSLACDIEAINRSQSTSYRNCINCGSDFIPKVKDRSTYCSRECGFLFMHREAWRIAFESGRLEHFNRQCATCDVRYYSQRDGVSYCSERCRHIGTYPRKSPIPTACIVCSRSIAQKDMGSPRVYCSKRCIRKANRKTRNIQRHIVERRRRSRLKAAKVGTVSPYRVFARDEWVCWICRDAIVRDAVYPDPLSPSVDHVIPVSKGGEHSMANVRAAHLICNSLKRDLILSECVAG